MLTSASAYVLVMTIIKAHGMEYQYAVSGPLTYAQCKAAEVKNMADPFRHPDQRFDCMIPE